MAHVFERYDKWYARYIHEHRPHQICTGVKIDNSSAKAKAESKKDATKALDGILADLNGRTSAEDLFRRLVATLAALPEIVRESLKLTMSERLRQGSTTRLALSEAWEAWLHSPAKHTPTQATVYMYEAYWGRELPKKHGKRQTKSGFNHWLAATHPQIKHLHEVTPAIAEEYAGHLWQSGIAPRTYNGAIKFLRSMFKVLSTRSGITTDPWHTIRTQDKDTKGRRQLTNKELDKICSMATGNLRAWLLIGLYTGLRLGDVITLRWSEIDFDKQVIRRVPNKTRRHGKVITFPLHPVLAAALAQLRSTAAKDATFLFPEEAATYRDEKNTELTNKIQAHFKACGIETTEEDAGPHRQRAIVRVGFHSLRHSFVSLCAANQVPQVAIQAMVGHGSPAMTELYSHADPKQQAKAIAGLRTVKLIPATTAAA